MFELMAKAVVAPVAGLALLLSGGAGVSAPPPPNVLQFDLAVDIDYVDPALSFFVPTWQIEYSTCSRLVNFPDASAPAGSVLQPEIAAGLPTVSPDGLTYTFTLRDDYVFSPPSNERVTAAHFKHAIDRLKNPMMNSPAQPFITDIVGVAASGSTLTITLSQPSGDLLTRLTMPFFCPLPTSVPIDLDGIDAPVPSAGPYYIASWTRTQEIVIRENPNYAGNRPHHFDEIHYTIGNPLETIKLRIETGEADLGDLPPAAHAELGQRYGPGTAPQRYFFYPAPRMLYLAMNHDRPLFGSGGTLGNVNLKKAVNYAIDREALVAQRGAYAGAVTDQHLPPGVPGFRDVPIYPARPDVARARELAGWSPGDAVRNGVLYCSETAPAPQQCQIVQANLREIGLEMEIKLFRRAEQFARAATRGEPFDMTLESWPANYLDPVNFLVLLDGSRLGPFGSTRNLNFAYFNDPVYNDRIHAANQLHGDARANAFGELDVDIAQNAAPWAAYGVPNDRHFFSERIGCRAYVPAFGISLGALCLRPSTSADDIAVAEGDAGSRAALFTVTLGDAAPPDFPVTLSYATSDGTGDASDYRPTSGTITFESGQTIGTIAVDVIGDTAHETDETFVVRFSGQSKGTIVRSAVVATIQNDDAAPPPPPPPPETQPPSAPTPPDTQLPTDPTLRSTSHRLGVRSIDRTVDIAIEGASDNQSGVDGFSFGWDRQQATLPDTVKDAEETVSRTTSPPLANGRWWFHLRTRDNAGNWTSTRHLGPFVIVPRARCVVPNVRGKTVRQARRMLAARRCALGRVNRAYSARVRTGRIIRQNRRPSARLPRGTRVNVVVSRGRRR
jgi:peptide/nickel transport system substrate-binding protein